MIDKYLKSIIQLWDFNEVHIGKPLVLQLYSNLVLFTTITVINECKKYRAQ
jgi:hypothetical protein